MYAYIAPTTTHEFTVYGAPCTVAVGTHVCIFCPPPPTSQFTMYGSCRYTCMHILPYHHMWVHRVQCTMYGSCTWLTCMRTAPHHLPKKVTKNPSKHTTGSSNEPQKSATKYHLQWRLNILAWCSPFEGSQVPANVGEQSVRPWMANVSFCWFFFWFLNSKASVETLALCMYQRTATKWNTTQPRVNLLLQYVVGILDVDMSFGTGYCCRVPYSVDIPRFGVPWLLCVYVCIVTTPTMCVETSTYALLMYFWLCVTSGWCITIISRIWLTNKYHRVWRALVQGAQWVDHSCLTGVHFGHSMHGFMVTRYWSW